MRKKLSKTHFMVFASILMLMSLSHESSERLRGTTAAMLGNVWGTVAGIKFAIGNFFNNFSFSSSKNVKEDEIQRLQLKTQRLETELKKIQTLLGEDLVSFFEFKMDYIPAQVIYRSPATWNSSLWVNVGREDNKTTGKEIIVKNSPVMLGTSVVGVIDYVGAKQSRVRLLTDSGLRPSVRVKRVTDKGTLWLAKGEVHGSSQPLWRSEAQVLHGIGFNCDFADDKGPARDLRTGKPLNNLVKSLPVPLIRVDDHLVTTGLDGVFPAGLDVATVTKITPLKEGDYYFELEAKPSLGNLHDVAFVFILPPTGYDPADQPPALGW